jgi:Flp pilus assembly protein TadG
MLLSRIAAPSRAFRNESGVAAVEFVLAAPFILFLMLGGFEVGKYVVASQRVELVASEIGEMVAQTLPSASAGEAGDGVLTGANLSVILDAAYFIMPDALASANAQGLTWQQVMDVSVTSIKFTTSPSGCNQNCSYTPSVVWWYGHRPCGASFTPVGDNSTPSPSTLPQDSYSSNSLIVVDVVYHYTPTFGAMYFPGASISRSFYITPRNVPIIESDGAAPASNCSGVL